jgi:hypothetical protein
MKTLLPPDGWPTVLTDGRVRTLRWHRGSAAVGAAVVHHLVSSALATPRGIGWLTQKNCAVEMLFLSGRARPGAGKVASALVDQARQTVREAREARKVETNA